MWSELESPATLTADNTDDYDNTSTSNYDYYEDKKKKKKKKKRRSSLSRELSIRPEEDS